MERSSDFPRIEKISIRGLFGLFDYDLPEEGRSFSNVAIFYGDNGTGKTTLLKLIYHLLSMDVGISHQEEIAQIPFGKAALYFSTGMRISASRAGSVDSAVTKFELFTDQERSYEHTAVRGTDKLFRSTLTTQPFQYITEAWNIGPGLMSGSLFNTVPLPKSQFIDALKAMRIPVDFISTERQILSTELKRLEDEGPTTTEAFLIQSGRSKDVSITELRRRDLKAAIERAEAWIESRVQEATNIGSVDANDIYSNVVRQLTSQPTKTKASGRPLSMGARQTLIRRIVEINDAYSEMGFTTPLRMDAILESFATAKPGQLQMVNSVIDPYINSIFARLNALNPIFEITHAFIESMNRFLSFKKMKFKRTEGFSIWDVQGKKLAPTELSSGEQQLLLLFCHILASRGKPRIVIIDEPEISLNVKWQRDLIEALLKIASNPNVQFLFASHSIEFISDHRKSVSSLRPTGQPTE